MKFIIETPRKIGQFRMDVLLDIPDEYDEKQLKEISKNLKYPVPSFCPTPANWVIEFIKVWEGN